MSKSFPCRLAVAQISANPAYADELVAHIQEPAFPGDEEKIGLFSIAGIETINALRQTIAEQYVLHLNQKLEAIIRVAASCLVELLVFPEYSIPAESLPLCRNLAEELKIAIVAGSHIVTVSSSAREVYKELNLGLDQGSPPLAGREVGEKVVDAKRNLVQELLLVLSRETVSYHFASLATHLLVINDSNVSHLNVGGGTTMDTSSRHRH